MNGYWIPLKCFGGSAPETTRQRCERRKVSLNGYHEATTDLTNRNNQGCEARGIQDQSINGSKYHYCATELHKIIWL